jgi:hypothetical protein
MNIEHMQYDKKRINTSISSTLLRERALTYWEFIPESVKPYHSSEKSYHFI